MYFDRSKCCEDNRVILLFIEPNGTNRGYYMRLTFHYTNNIAKYEALYRGLTITHRELWDRNLIYLKDIELILKKFKNQF